MCIRDRFIYHDAFNSNETEVNELKARYEAGKVGDVEVKDCLARAVNEVLEPIRERRAEIAAKPDEIQEIVMDGSSQARAIAQETMKDVRDAVRLKYGDT